MAASTPSRVGQIQGAGAVDALWLKVFAGEILEAFDTMVKTLDKHRVRTIESGKSAQFPATFKASASYHTPGAEILGQTIEHNEVIVTLDDLLIADAFVDTLDEMKNHYEVRAPYSHQLGQAVALAYDRNVSRTITLSARGGALFTGDTGGSTLDKGATVATDADVLISAINEAKQTLDEKDVPVDNFPIFSMVKPAQFYLIANSDKNINRDTGPSSLDRQVLRTVSDIQIVKSNAVKYGVDESAEATVLTKYRGDWTDTIALVWQEAAAATLKLLDLQMEVAYDPRRQGTLLLAKLAVGSEPLRTKCAVEITKA